MTRYLYKERITDMLAYSITQGEFILETTANISSANDFMSSQYGMILYNSTCMCLQTIGETLKQIDNLTSQQFLAPKYGKTPWRNIFALRNIIPHEYASTDPEEIYGIIRHDLLPLLSTLRTISADVTTGKHDELFHD